LSVGDTELVHAPAQDLEEALPGGHVLVSGWGRTARAVAADLHASGIPVVVVTLSPDGAAEAEDAGHAVVRGDSTRALVLHQARIDEARAVLVGDDEPGQAALIAGVVATVAPRVPVVVLGREEQDVPDLAAAGATQVVLAERASASAVALAVRSALEPAAPPRGPTVPDTATVVAFRADADSACAHAGLARPVVPRTPGCEQCLREGASWVHLRLCVSCGHVGCCESSPGRHASAHAAEDDGHALIASLEPGEDWGWCYLDATTLVPDRPAARAGR